MPLLTLAIWALLIAAVASVAAVGIGAYAFYDWIQ